jgi:hypothetical protein
MTRHLVSICLVLAATGRAQIGAPEAGCVLDREGALRPLYGMAGIFVPGEAIAPGVVSAACSDKFALVKTEYNLELRDAQLRLIARWPAPGGPARFAFPPTGMGALVYYPLTGDLVRIIGSRPPRPLACALPDEVLAIASPDPAHILAVISGGGMRLVRVSLSNGAIDQEIEITGASGPAWLRRDGTLVYGDGAEVVMVRPEGSSRRWTLPAPASAIYQMGENLEGIMLAKGATAVLTLEEGREQLLRLPEATR